MNRYQIRQMTFSAMFLGLCIVLPFLTGQIPQIGAMLSPMHIPVLICGFICGPVWGMIVGILGPLLRSVMFGMPKLFPTAIAMAFELAAYGASAGILIRLLPNKSWSIYVALIASMILGRIVWGVVQYVLLGMSGSSFTMEMFLAGALTNALPGIILHIAIIPPIVLLLRKTGLNLNGKR